MYKRVLAFSLLMAATSPATVALAQTADATGEYGPLPPTANPPIFLQLPSDLMKLSNRPEEAADAPPRFFSPDPIAGRASKLSPAPRSSQDDTKTAGRLIARGSAVWYEHSGRTASGERFNPDALTAAHRSLPFGSRVRVVNRTNGKSVTVRINDRISKIAARDKRLVIDLSRAAAKRLEIEGREPVALYLESAGAPIVASDPD